jgi:hypothetical protein
MGSFFVIGISVVSDSPLLAASKSPDGMKIWNFDTG